MPVGSGKTLTSLLAPAAVNAQRPVLLVPAKLAKKTEYEFKQLLEDWHVRLPTIVSYETLGRAQHEHKLAGLKPDLLIMDEAHCVRNLRAACTKRVRRFIEENDGLKVLAMSGTLMTQSFLDYHHLAVWSLGDHAPVPVTRREAEKWSSVLDIGFPIFNRDQDVKRNIQDTFGGRQGYHDFFRDRHGVVCGKGHGCDASLVLQPWTPKYPDELSKVIADVQLTALRPDGEPLDDYDLPRCLSELALGFYNVWDPLPPDWWLKPRRAYNAFVRDILEQDLVGLDSDYQVALAIDNGRLPAGAKLRDAWLAVKDEFVPNPVPIWLTDEILLQIVKFANREPMIVWNKFRASGERLAELGLPYYGADTLPEAHSPKQSMACSIAAHGTGKNLQAWSSNLLLHLPGSPEMWEQLLGRTHRAGQMADEVRVSYISSLSYHMQVMSRVKQGAKRTRDISGFEQKLNLATWLDPS
jgi:hypothetical protein